MKLTCWEGSIGRFAVVRFHKTNILLPCEGDLVHELKSSNKATIQQPSKPLGLLADCCHVVLVSSPVELLLLPYVLRHFPYQQHLPDIYCTVDCLRVAEQLHTEVKPLEANVPSCWDTAEDDSDCSDDTHGCWWSLNTILQAVQALTFGQVCNINDVELQTTAWPNGMGIGCAVWVINTPTCRIGYASQASLYHPFAAVLSPDTLQSLDVLLLGPSCMDAAHQAPCPLQTLLSEVCNLVVATLRAGGNVLLPVLLTGTALALLEQVLAAVEASGLAPACSPVLFVSPAANSAVMVGMTAADSLNLGRQQALLAGQHPFPFNAAKQAGRLLLADSLADAAVQASWKTPACVFVSACSLDYGAGSQLLRKWAYEDRSQVILTERTFLSSAQEALKAQLPPDFRIKVCAPASAPGLSFLELAQLLQGSPPEHVVLLDAAMEGLTSLPTHSRGLLATSEVHAYRGGQCLQVPTPNFAPSAVISSQMAASVKMHQLAEKFAAVRVACHMQFQDDQWQLLRLPTQSVPKDISKQQPQPCLWGTIALQPLISKLEADGAEVDVRFDGSVDGGVTTLHIQNWDATIRLSATKTEIEAGTLGLRYQLGKAIVEQLQSF